MKLQLTNGYHPHFDQIARILQYLLTQRERKKLAQQELVGALGMSKRQVENLISVAVGFGLIAPHTSILTSLGTTVALRDPFFERIETLWILHYVISSNPEWVVWHRVVNQVIPQNENVAIAEIARPYFADLSGSFSERTLREKLPKEIGAVLWTYAQSDLARLNLLGQESTGVYVRRVPEDIPPLPFLYCVLEYRSRHAASATAMPVTEIARDPDSPGVVLCLAEYSVRSLLDRLHDAGLVRMEQFGDLDQVRFASHLSQSDVLDRMYGAR